MSTLATLVVKIVGDINEYSASLQKAQGSTDSFAGKAVSGLSAIGGTVVMAGLTAAATATAAIGTAAWKSAETMDQAYDTIQARTGATGDTLKALQVDLDNVFKKVPTDAQTAADVISALNQKLGQTGPSLEADAVKLLNMTKLLGGDAKTNTELFGRAMQDAGLPLDESGVLLDKLFVASQKSGLGVDSLMQKLVQFGAPMRNMGFDLDTSIALFAKWEKEGVNAELVMGSLRIAATKFAKDNIPLNEGLADAITKIKGAKDASEALALASGIFGARAAGDMAAAIREGRFDIEDMTAALASSDGAINKTAASTADWGEKWTIFTNKLTLSLAPIGDVLRSVAGQAMDMLNAFLERPEVQKALEDLGTWIADMAKKAEEWLPKVQKWFANLWKWFEDNQWVVVAVLAVIGAAIVAWAVTSAIAIAPVIIELLPVIVVILLIAAAAVILYLAWTQNWGGIQEKTAVVWEWLQPKFQALVTWFQNDLPRAMQGLADWLSTNIPKAIQTLSEAWNTKFLPPLRVVWAFVVDIFLPAFIAVYRFFATLFMTGLHTLEALLTKLILPALKDVAKALGIDLNPAFKGLHSIVDSTFPVLRNLGTFFGDVLLKALLGIAEALVIGTRNLDNMTNALNNLKLPSWLTPGSPTPWEIGLWGIGDALESLNDTHLPAFNDQLQLQPAGVGLGESNVGAGVKSRFSADGSGQPLAVNVNIDHHPTISAANDRELQAKIEAAVVAILKKFKIILG